MGRFIMFSAWIVVLLMEVFYLYNTIHRVHDFDETLFGIVVIVITLVVGTVGTLVTRNKWLE